MDSFYIESGFYQIMFRIVPIFIGMIFIIVIVGILQGIIQWKKNNNSPVLSVAAVLVAKRTSVSHHTHNTGQNNAHSHQSSSTAYYATFEVESGDRMEFALISSEYGMLAEGDAGILTFQGTRYITFERSRN